jgi:hypothetical protein
MHFLQPLRLLCHIIPASIIQLRKVSLPTWI